MSKAMHTKGPWSIGHEYAMQKGCVTIDAKCHGALAEVVWQMEDDADDGVRSLECEANAHLIVAAPAMLAELKHCKDVLAIVNGVDKDLVTKEALERVSSVIAKAEGGL